MLRAVVDVNVLVSGVIGRAGPPREILSHWRSGEFEILVSRELLRELEGVLARRRVAARTDPDSVQALFDGLEANAIFVEPAVTHDRDVPRDPDNDYLVTLATAGGAHVIVTGDRHLLDRDGLRPAALTPTAFLELLGRIG